ncbi:SgcJ/EcaC family oxidoreductase [Modestobacter sp. VKM Ac-2978]|uniref:SgcJ/EcaC family oxidoreductase n=1 Tax=Modestobacter sp. VKM Ac-2978 TaxID=3004132 RepID=UPI0022AA82B4|nr:SgcJ/EcaC family oxidoreductase [Modestobacter sp. VKM Ac-2978]MCZ2849095.1 SgcJ/EcaC family oxidoreductase [Modestobacter sp. VKM Ac-2978]
MTGAPADRPRAAIGPVPDDVAAAVTAVLAGIQSGFNAKTPGTSMGGFLADAVSVSPDGRRTSGADELTEYHQHRLTGPARHWRIQQEVQQLALVDEDTVVADVHQRMQTPEGDFTNRGTAVLVRRAGEWWIARFHDTRATGG